MIAKFLGLFVLLRGRKQVRNSWRKMGFSPTFFQSVCVERKRKRTVLLKVGKEIEFQARPAIAEYEGPQSGFSPTQPPENNVPLENTTPLRMDPEPTAAHFALSGRKETFMLRYGKLLPAAVMSWERGREGGKSTCRMWGGGFQLRGEEQKL